MLGELVFLLEENNQPKKHSTHSTLQVLFMYILVVLWASVAVMVWYSFWYGANEQCWTSPDNDEGAVFRLIKATTMLHSTMIGSCHKELHSLLSKPRLVMVFFSRGKENEK